MRGYLIELKDKLDGTSFNVVCSTRDFRILVSNLEYDKFDVNGLEVLDNFTHYSEFCKTEKNLETGNEKRKTIEETFIVGRKNEAKQVKRLEKEEK